ncbi:unnamed protein product [Adineta ricciae]|uniref:Uncharacterized protein n=1 Tax=Adineta ricciae TaxID=249248 RepID=A0A815UMH1_ADIRI|nr:unnamed protein product [Adineta ricciae]
MCYEGFIEMCPTGQLDQKTFTSICKTSSVRRAHSLHSRLWKTYMLSSCAINEANRSSNFTCQRDEVIAKLLAPAL